MQMNGVLVDWMIELRGFSLKAAQNGSQTEMQTELES